MNGELTGLLWGAIGGGAVALIFRIAEEGQHRD